MSCVRCNSEDVTKDGTTSLGGQRFCCGNCGRRFTRRSNSAFSRRAFADDIIVLAVRCMCDTDSATRKSVSGWPSAAFWWTRAPSSVGCNASYRCLARWLASIVSRSVPTGGWTRRTLASAAVGITSIAPSMGVVRSSMPTSRQLAIWGRARAFFERAVASTGTTPRRVVTGKAATYPPALAVVVPDVKQRTGRYRTNGVEHDHGFLKERLRPMRGLKSISSATIFIRSHALIRNIRRGFIVWSKQFRRGWCSRGPGTGSLGLSEPLS
jgi:hypothetical protein